MSERVLALAILAQAMKDWHLVQRAARSGKPARHGWRRYDEAMRHELLRFFSSQWFETLCDVGNVDFERVLRKALLP